MISKEEQNVPLPLLETLKTSVVYQIVRLSSKIISNISIGNRIIVKILQCYQFVKF